MATVWLNVDLRFRDRYTGKVRDAPNQVIEVVVHSGDILFQDMESGTHRMVPPEHVEGIRLAQHVVWDEETGELT